MHLRRENFRMRMETNGLTPVLNFSHTENKAATEMPRYFFTPPAAKISSCGREIRRRRLKIYAAEFVGQSIQKNKNWIEPAPSLLREEEEKFAAALEIYASGFAGRPSTKPKTNYGCSFSFLGDKLG
jgi:hypothetical protein